MPAKSRQQYKFFKVLENNPELRKSKGISEETVKDYTEGMTKKKFAKLKKYMRKKDS